MQKKTNYKTNHKHRTSNTFKTFGGEENSGKSITVQDESYTVRELLEKHVQGLMPNVGLNPEYDTEKPSLDDDMLFRRQNLDLTDIDDLKKKVGKTKSKLAKQKEKQAKENKKIEVNDLQNDDIS